MLEGALLGAVIGLVIALTQMSQRKNLLKQISASIQRQGAGRARGILDGKLPRVELVRLNDIDKQSQRMAFLALLGDTQTLEHEIAQHHGKLTAVTQVNSIAYLGLILRSAGEQRARYIAALDEVAAKMEREGGSMMALVKKKTRALALLGHGLLREPIPVLDKAQLDNMSRMKSSTGILISQALGESQQMLNRTDLATQYFDRVRAFTTAFEPSQPNRQIG